MPSEWTIDTLREHFDQIMAERDRAVVKLADEVSSRFTGTNQWREAVMDIQSRNVSRATFDGAVESLRREITNLQSSLEQRSAEKAKELSGIMSDLRSLRDGFADFRVSTDQRFHTVNEFRAAMGDQQKTYLPKTTWDTGHEFLRAQVEQARLNLVEHSAIDERWQGELREQITSLRARMYGASAALAAVMAVVVALVALLRINA